MTYVLGRVCARPGCGTVVALERITCKACWSSHVPRFIRDAWDKAAPVAVLNALRQQVFAWFKAPPEDHRACDVAGCGCRFFHLSPARNGCKCGHTRRTHVRPVDLN